MSEKLRCENFEDLAVLYAADELGAEMRDGS